MAVVENAVRLLAPEKLYDAGAVLGRPSVVPAVPGTYAWYFAQVPAGVPTNGCQRLGEAWLLYVGISPKKPSSDGRMSRQTMRTRLRYHYRGNAAGSTLRLTLGCLLSDDLGIRLQRVGTRDRLTFGAGESVLSQWMAENAKVAWVADAQPWILEDHLIETVSLPLNLQGNGHHPFRSELSAVRSAARAAARSAD